MRYQLYPQQITFNQRTWHIVPWSIKTPLCGQAVVDTGAPLQSIGQISTGTLDGPVCLACQNEYDK